MDPSVSDDDECLSIQLEGSDMAPKAKKTVLRQRFQMRRFHLEADGRLTNLAKVMDRPADQVSTCTTASAESSFGGFGPNNDTTNMITESIAAFLQPHTSSPSMPLIARAMTSLITGDFGGEDLNQVLSAQLDSLAISPQAKQTILPALLGIAKLTHVQSQSTPTLIPPSQHTLLVSESLLAGSDSRASSSSMSTTAYQIRQRPFSSNSGSGYTNWYCGKSDSSILLPPTIPQAKTGHLYVHLDTSRNVYQYWMLSVGNQWERASKGVEYPLNHDRVLAIRSNGEPSWITRASTSTTQTRKEKESREKSV